MRLLMLSIIVLIGAILLGLEIQKDPGTFSVAIRGQTYETSAAVAAGLLIAAFAAFYVVARLGGRLWQAPKLLRRYTGRRRQRAAHRALDRGILELAQGHWPKALRKLATATAHPETATLGYLTAARAAQRLGKPEQRDRLLQLAQDQSAGRNSLAVGITQAELLMQNQELEKAAQLLRELYRADPKNRLVLELLKECYLDAHAWQELAQLTPLLEKAGVLTANERLHMERNAYAQILASAASTGSDSRALDSAWASLPHGLRREPEMLSHYVRYLIEHGEGARPESILRTKIKHQWDDQLVYLYGLVGGTAPAQQLATAERWLKRHPDDATLLLTLGRLALRNHLWGKARTYLERSAEIDPRPETYMLLGKLLEQSGDKLVAGEAFRKGLGITVSKNALLIERSAIESAAPALAPAVAGGAAVLATGGAA